MLNASFTQLGDDFFGIGAQLVGKGDDTEQMGAFFAPILMGNFSDNNAGFAFCL